MKDQEKVILNEGVTLYAPAGARYHEEGEQVKVGVVVADSFKALGYSETKPKVSTKKATQE